MHRTGLPVVWCGLLAVALTVAGTARANSGLGHRLIGLRTLVDMKEHPERYGHIPPEVRAQLTAGLAPDANGRYNLAYDRMNDVQKCFLNGTTGPDNMHIMPEAHEDGVGMARRLMERAMAEKDPARRAQMMAYCYGFETHVVADSITHAMLNQTGFNFDYDSAADHKAFEDKFDLDAAQAWFAEHATDPATALTNAQTDNAFTNEDDGGIESTLVDSNYLTGYLTTLWDVGIYIITDYGTGALEYVPLVRTTPIGVVVGILSDDDVQRGLTGQNGPTESPPAVTRGWIDTICQHVPTGTQLIQEGPKDLTENLDHPEGRLLVDPPKPPPGEYKWPEPLKVNWPEPVSLR
jgi:hypothetical protein